MKGLIHMYGKVSFQEFSDSQFAINKFIRAVDGNISSSGEQLSVEIERNGYIIFKEVKRVRAHIETNESIVIIYDMPSGYYEEYKNRFQNFEFDGEKLAITAEDRSGDDITIYIYV